MYFEAIKEAKRTLILNDSFDKKIAPYKHLSEIFKAVFDEETNTVIIPSSLEGYNDEALFFEKFVLYILEAKIKEVDWYGHMSDDYSVVKKSENQKKDFYTFKYDFWDNLVESIPPIIKEKKVKHIFDKYSLEI
jgi:hypothetical protein